MSDHLDNFCASVTGGSAIGTNMGKTLLIGSSISDNVVFVHMLFVRWCCVMLQVLYVANAEVLTDGGFYSSNEAAGGWDTPQAAQYILHNLLASHKDALAALKTADGARSLAEVRLIALYLQGHADSMPQSFPVLYMILEVLKGSLSAGGIRRCGIHYSCCVCRCGIGCP